MARCSFGLTLILILLSCLSHIGLSERDIVVDLYQTSYTVSESDSTTESALTVCLYVSGNLNISVDLHFAVSGGTASESSDYRLNNNHTLFPGSVDYNGYYCRQVIQVCEDIIPENDENVTIIISTTAVRVSLTRNTFTLHIIDNDDISIAFTRNTYTVEEGKEIEVCVQTSGNSERSQLQLSLQSLPESASNLDFFVAGIHDQLHRITAEGDIIQKCMTLAAEDDALPEDEESFRVSVSSVDSRVTINRNSVRIYITDNDPTVFTLPKKVYEVVEGENAEVCLLLANHDLPRIRFHLTVLPLSGNATAEDYTIQNMRDFTVGFNMDGRTRSRTRSRSNEICFDILTTDDYEMEGTEAVLLQLQLSTDALWVDLVLPNGTITEIIIQDNDVVTVQFSVSSHSVTEGSFPYLSFCLITMNAVIGAHVNVMLNVTTISSSAVGGRDFEVIDREVPLPIYSVCHQLHIIDDAEPEFEEEFYICVQHNPLVEILTECAEVHIIDDDTPELAWSESRYVASESKRLVEVCTELRGTLHSAVEVQISTEDYTAVGFYDYLQEENIFLFGPSLEQRQCRHIQILTDELIEDTEIFRVLLTPNHNQTDVLSFPHPYTLVHIQDDSVRDSACVEGSIELNKGVRNDSYNLVEICNSGKWTSVCDSEWSLEDVATICSQAGYARRATDHRSLPSLRTAAEGFNCTAIETSLAQCLVVRPDNTTCQHLELICANGGVVTALNSPVPTSNGGPSSSHIPSDSSFSIMGVVVGALLLVCVVTLIGIVVGALLCRRKCKSVNEDSTPSNHLDNPVYEILEDRQSNSVSTTPTSCNTDSSHANSELYSEVLPLSPPTTAVTLPSLYDVIRLPLSESEGVTTEVENGILRDKIPPYAETNVYESLPDPFPGQDEEEEYSSLDRRRNYATLEPYTGSGAPRKEIAQYQGEEEEEYAHLHH